MANDQQHDRFALQTGTINVVTTKDDSANKSSAGQSPAGSREIHREVWESGPLEQVATILDVLMARALQEGDRQAFTYLADGRAIDLQWTYAELAAATLWVRQQLPDAVDGQRVLLIFEPGLAFLAAYLGVMAAGAVAVPCHPPMGNTQIQRMLGVVMDSQPQVVMYSKTISEGYPQLQQFAQAAQQMNMQLVEVDVPRTPTITPTAFAAFRSPPAEALAMLQYTSASTGDPKGVMITHANLMRNCEAIYHWLGPDDQRKGCIWLPPYHDMGLLGGIMQPLFAGFPLVFMSPLHFIQEPLRWLQALSQHRASITGAPNFAFQLCVEQISDEALATADLDLSCVREIFCGAEPIHPRTMQAFAQRYAAYGFRHEAINPCYGMAEATLLVSGKPYRQLPRYLHFARTALEQGQAQAIPAATAAEMTAAAGDTDGQPHLEIVSCGHPAKGLDIRIVDPDSGGELPAGRVGEIWISGPSMASGYWRKPELNQDLFHNTLAGTPTDESAPATHYYRSGDLGFIQDGEVFVTGRIKDLIIVRGRNLYPQDIERAALAAHPALSNAIAAAFAVDGEHGEEVVVVTEIRKELQEQAAEISQAVSRAVRNAFQVTPQAVYLGPPRTVLRTTSGKIRRSACRDAFQQQQLKQFPQAVAS